MDRLECEGDYNPTFVELIFLIDAKRLIQKGCFVYFCTPLESSVEVPPIMSISMVCEFLEVFPTYLLSMPPYRNIDLKSYTHPISISPYIMTPIELIELKA